MDSNRLRIAPDVKRQICELGLETLVPKLEALGVRSQQDLALVDDADLVRWGLSTIERRRFFGHVRGLLGDQENDGTLALLPPSALTTVALPAAAKKAGSGRTRRPEAAAMGPARLDELLGRGSAEHQVPRLAERLLAATGPLDVFELAVRLARAAPALAQGYEEEEWPQFVDASVRTYRRLQVEEGVLQDDKPIVSICNSVLFSASEEVVADTSCWVRVIQGVATPRQVAILACLCRASREVADGPEVWSKLLSKWYPKATLLNPDWVAQADLEKRLEEALENDYAFAALTKRLEPDTPCDIGDLLKALPQQTTPKALMKFMSRHPDNFKQSPDGLKFCISRRNGDLDLCKDWRTVNPFRTPPLPKKTADDASSSRAPVVPMGRPSELRAAEAGEKIGASDSGQEPPEKQQDKTNICQRLDPKQAFRLYHTGLLSQRTDQSKRGKLEAWEYYSESNSKCVMGAGDLCDLCESRVGAIRANDPAVVHELVAQTLEGLVYKVPFGFWNRRVRILSNSLNASQLRIGREQRKKYERKLLEFMEWVKKERGFGYYQCQSCGCRWKSGFSYEEIMQQCLQCNAWAKPFRIQDLESALDREAREKGDPSMPTRKLPPAAYKTSRAPLIDFQPPRIEHTAGAAGRRVVVPPPGQAGQEKRPGGGAWQNDQHTKRLRTETAPQGRTMHGGSSGSNGSGQAMTASSAPPVRASSTTPSPAATPQSSSVSAGSSTQQNASKPQYTPGGGGFFAQRRAATAGGESAASSTSVSASSTSASTTGNATDNAAAVATHAFPPEPPATYTPGGGGFFARRRAAAAASAGGANETATPNGSIDSTNAAAASVTAGNVANDATATSTTPAQYTPGGGGFFARRRAAAAAAAGGSNDTAALHSSTDSTNATAAAATAGDIANDAAATSTAPAQYTPGGGGFFARRRAAAAAAAATASEPVASSSSTETSSTVTPGVEQTAQYTPGGGGFFARRRAAAAAAAGNDSAAASAVGDDAAARRERSRSPRGNGAASSSSHPAPVNKTQDSAEASGNSVDISALGLSEDEAKAMGLLLEAPAPANDGVEGTPDIVGEQAANVEAVKVSCSSAVEDLGLNEDEARAMGLLPELDGQEQITNDKSTDDAAKKDDGNLVDALGLSEDEARAMGLLSESVSEQNAMEAGNTTNAGVESTSAEERLEGTEDNSANNGDCLGQSSEAVADPYLPETSDHCKDALEVPSLDEKPSEDIEAAISNDAGLESLGLSEEEARAMGLLQPEVEESHPEPSVREATPEECASPQIEASADSSHAKSTSVSQSMATTTNPVVAAESHPLDVASDAVPSGNGGIATHAIPPDKLLALKTLGLSIEDGVRMGIIPAAPPMAATVAAAPTDVSMAGVASPQPTPAAATPADAADEDGHDAMEVDKGSTEAMEVDQDAEHPDPYEEEGSADAATLIGVPTGEALVEAVTAVVTFVHEGTGAVQELTRQSSDVAYLLSDAVTWPLLRRLAAETAVLEACSGNHAPDEASWAEAWQSAPCGSDAFQHYATERGYLLPDVPAASIAGNDKWRRVLLMETAADLMTARMLAGRGFPNLPALAGPPPDSTMGDTEMSSDIAVVAATAAGDTERVVTLAKQLVDDVSNVTSRETAVASACSSSPVHTRLAHAVDSIVQRPLPALSSGSDGPALSGGWSLMQEMSIREIALALREEYTVRRHILLRRLDVTVEAMSAGKLVDGNVEGQRKFADTLARMWGSWRRGAAQAPKLSEWSALMVMRSTLVRAITARISGPSTRLVSAVKSVRIGNVPGRGGIPETYGARTTSSRAGSTTAALPAAPPRQAPKSGPPRPTNSIRVTDSGSGSSSSSVATLPVGTGSAQPGDTAEAAPGDPSTNDAPSQVAAKPNDKKDIQVGARSTNKELMHQARVKQKEEAKQPNTYWEQLHEARGGT